ncbi:MAG TPA: phosphatase PAP2 family protein [Gemmatimonadales bacterium]|jgi:hypothetical protein
MAPAGTSAGPRVLAVAGVALLHLVAYLVVTRVNAARPEHALWDLATALDGSIPHLPLTWPFYWLVYPFVPAVGMLAMRRMSDPLFRRCVLAFSGMLLLGALVQLLLPARAPWPDSPAPMQHLYHSSGLVLPYANLPSMHVAFAVLAAAMYGSVGDSRLGVLAAATGALAITVATLTLKEHYVLDAVAGVALALAAWWWWWSGAGTAGWRIGR